MRRCHPGGEALTRYLIALAGWGEADAVLDVGCGEGASTALLRTLCSLRCRGIDPEPGPDAPEHILRGRACALPFADEAFDGVLFECSLSLTQDPVRALEEAFRVLRRGGRLALANVTAHKEGAAPSGCLGRLETWETQRARLERAGFSLRAEEDRTEELISLFGELILNGEAPDDTAALRRARPGYRISVWQK